MFMFIQATQLIGQAVGAEDIEARVGQIERLIINPTNGQLIACAVKTGGWFGKVLYLSPIDIRTLTKEFVIIRKINQLSPVEDLIRLKNILQNRVPILGQKARTQSGTNLGQIVDLLFETDSWLIAKYYVRQFLSERILPADTVQSITHQAVIFFDRVGQQTNQILGESEPSIST